MPNYSDLGQSHYIKLPTEIREDPMKGSTSKLVVVLLVAFSSTMALVRAYHVEPVRVAQSGWTKHANGRSEGHFPAF